MPTQRLSMRRIREVLGLRHQGLVASIEDLLATKLKAIMDRAEAMSNGAPLANWAIGHDHHAAPLVAPADELEEQVRRVRLEWQIAELVDDEQLRLGELRQLILEPAFGMRLPAAIRAARRAENLHPKSECPGNPCWSWDAQIALHVGDPYKLDRG